MLCDLPALNTFPRLLSWGFASLWLMIGLITSQPVIADELCALPVKLFEDIKLPKNGLSAQAEIKTVNGFDRPFIKNAGSGLPILTISNNKLQTFNDPPLDQWNRLMPTFVYGSDKKVWDFNSVKSDLYFLDRSKRQFIRSPLSDLNDNIQFMRTDKSIRHEDRSLHHDSKEPFIALTKKGLTIIKNGKPIELPPPPNWKQNDGAPFYISDVGWFMPVKEQSWSRTFKTIWFRNFQSEKWHAIAEFRILKGVMAQSPFQFFQVRHSKETGAIWILLEDRVLVGRINKNSQIPTMDYQFAGDIIIHQPNERVLVYSGKPIIQKQSDQPEWYNAKQGLWEMTSGGPTRVKGFSAKERAGSFKIPLLEHSFHTASGLTLIGHSTGFASFDGTLLKDLPQLATDKLGIIYLEPMGNKLIARKHDWFGEVIDELNVRPITIPNVEKPNRLRLAYSSGLGQYFLFCEACKNVFYSKDLTKFNLVKGIDMPISSILGDMPSGKASVLFTKSNPYLIEYCKQ